MKRDGAAPGVLRIPSLDAPRLQRLCAASGLFFLSVAQLLGPLSALFFLLSLAGLVFADWRRTVLEFGGAILLFALPILALLSTVWSVSANDTLRSAIQYFLTFLFAVLAARIVNFKHIVSALFFSNFVAIAICYGDLPAALSAGRAMQGFFGSKNQFAFSSVVLLLTSLQTFGTNKSQVMRLMAIVGFLMGCGGVALGQSAGAFTSLCMSLVAFFAAQITRKLSPTGRVVVLMLMLVALPLVVWQKAEIENLADNFRQGVLKKDASLTGRTYLWYRADIIAESRPVFGRGYQSFWKQGSTDAEGLWQWGHIVNRGGFNFHSEFRDLRVDLGWVGVSVFVITLISASISVFVGVFRGREYAPILISLFVFLVARINIETSLIYPFSILTAMYVLLATAALSDRLSGEPESRKQSRVRVQG